MISTLVLLGCNKDDNGPNDPSYGTMSVLVNGENWGERYPGHYKTIFDRKGISGTAIPCPSTYYLLTLTIYNNQAFRREKIIFIKIPLQEAKHKVVQFKFECNDTDPVYADFNTISDDGDVLQDHFEVLETEDNYIKVDSYNSKTFEIKGTFQVTFVIERRSANDPSTLPDTLKFTNGSFNTKIMME